MAEENEPNLTSSDLDKELSETYRQMVSALTAAALEDKLELFDSDQNAFMRYREQHLVFLRSGAVENGTMTEKTAEHDRYEMNQLRIRQIKYSLDLLK